MQLPQRAGAKGHPCCSQPPAALATASTQTVAEVPTRPWRLCPPGSGPRTPDSPASPGFPSERGFPSWGPFSSWGRWSGSEVWLPDLVPTFIQLPLGFFSQWGRGPLSLVYTIRSRPVCTVS